MTAPFRTSTLSLLIPALLGLTSPALATLPIRRDVTYAHKIAFDLAVVSHEILWSGQDSEGALLEPGVYSMRVSSRGEAKSVRLVQGVAAR